LAGTPGLVAIRNYRSACNGGGPCTLMVAGYVLAEVPFLPCLASNKSEKRSSANIQFSPTWFVGTVLESSARSPDSFVATKTSRMWRRRESHFFDHFVVLLKSVNTRR